MESFLVRQGDDGTSSTNPLENNSRKLYNSIAKL